MDRTAEGEYELVVGNRHLLSVVFILIVLFGVFFTLGYFVGRNSADMVAAQPPAQPRAGGVAQPREAPPPAAAPAEQAAAPDDAKSRGTVPVTPAAGSEPPAAVEPKPEIPAPPPAAAPAKDIAGAPAPGETYLQVAAVKRGVAEGIADVLKQKGFRAVVAPVIVNGVASGDLFRVLVGPVSDASDLAKTRSDIEAAGMGRAIVRKY